MKQLAQYLDQMRLGLADVGEGKNGSSLFSVGSRVNLYSNSY